MSGIIFPPTSGSSLLVAIPDRNVLGNVSGTTAIPSAVTSAQLTGLVNVFTTTSSGAVPSSGSNSTSLFLNANGTFSSPSGGLSFLYSKTTASGLTLDFTSSIDGTYTTYQFILENVVPAVNASAIMTMQVSTNNGTSFIASNYLNANVALTGTVSSILLSNVMGTSSGLGLSGDIYISNPSSSANKKIVYGNTVHVSPNGNVNNNGAAGWYNNDTSAINAFRFAMTTGALSGTIYLYGVKGS